MVSIERVVEMVDINNLYNHVLALEGVKHALDSYEKLKQGAEYIQNTFEKYRINNNRVFFSVHGLDKEFYDVQGSLLNQMDLSEPTLMITSHFDTVYSTPGADDNASGVAVMLEVARILKESKYEKNVLFVSFNLEEFAPHIQNLIRNVGTKYGVFDETYRYVSWPLKKFAALFKSHIIDAGPIKSYLDEDMWKEFEGVAKNELSETELKFFKKQNQIFRDTAQNDPFGRSFCVGSDAYSKYVLENKMNIEGVINIESVGFVSDKPHSQTLPVGVEFDMFDTFGINEDHMIGNFIAVFADENSKNLASTFFKASKHHSINLPCACLAVPFNYEVIKNNMPDLLRSDHAPFWRIGIPAIMITDTATFRNPYYHTGGDTINTLDFPFMSKVCQTTLATIIESQRRI